MGLQELFEMAIKGAEENFNQNGSVAQVALASTKRGQNLAVVCGWANQRERAGTIAVLKSLFREQQVTCYALISEVWTLAHEDRRPGVMPSDSERREEAVVVIATDGKTKLFSQKKIERPFDGPAKLVDPDIKPDGLEGDLFDLLE
jgi:hypothetical protein